MAMGLYASTLSNIFIIDTKECLSKFGPYLRNDPKFVTMLLQPAHLAHEVDLDVSPFICNSAL